MFTHLKYIVTYFLLKHLFVCLVMYCTHLLCYAVADIRFNSQDDAAIEFLATETLEEEFFASIKKMQPNPRRSSTSKGACLQLLPMSNA
jgi:hypothetical protein